MAPKEEKKNIDEFVGWAPDKLLDEYYNLNTFDEAKKRNEKIGDAIEDIEEVERKYFITKRGKRDSGAPKSRKLSKEKAREEASDLVNELILHAIKKELGEDTAKAYKKNPHQLTAYAQGKGVNYFGLVNALAANYKSPTKLEEYQKAKQALAGGTVAELGKYHHLKQHIASRQMDEGFMDSAKKHFSGKTGREAKARIGIEGILEHYSHHAKHGKFTDEYLDQVEDDFKKKAA